MAATRGHRASSSSADLLVQISRQGRPGATAAAARSRKTLAADVMPLPPEANTAETQGKLH